MAAPIRSQAEIDTIINKGNNTLADLGFEISNDAKRGEDLTETGFRDKVYRLILLRAYLRNIIDPNTSEPRLFYTAAANQLKFNNLLNAIVALSNQSSSAGAIPRINSAIGTVIYYPSTSGPSTGGGSSSGGPANPGGVTFQNVNISAPGEVVDRMDAANNDYAFYIIRVNGSGSGEGSRLDIVGANWRGGSTPVITTYRGDGVGGTVPVTVYYSAAIVSGQMELTCNVPTDGWSVKGTRISFENISFQNAQGPLPTGGTLAQYLRKSSSVDFDAAFATIQLSEIAGLATALANRLLLAGGTMTGPIDMGSNKITSLDDGADPGDAVNKGQMDAAASSGTYTPTFTSISNDDGSSANGSWFYTKIGSIVTVSGQIIVDPTASGVQTIVDFTIPIASSFSTTGQLAGNAATGQSGAETGIVQSQAADDRARLTFYSVGTGPTVMGVTFQYRII